MNDREAYEFYANPANQAATGPGRERSGQRLTSMSSVRFPPGVIEQVKGLADREGVTVGAWIRRAVGREIPGALGSSSQSLRPAHVRVRAPERRQRHVRGVRDLRAAASGRLMGKHCPVTGKPTSGQGACTCGACDDLDEDEGGDDAA